MAVLLLLQDPKGTFGLILVDGTSHPGPPQDGFVGVIAGGNPPPTAGLLNPATRQGTARIGKGQEPAQPWLLLLSLCRKLALQGFSLDGPQLARPHGSQPMSVFVVLMVCLMREPEVEEERDGKGGAQNEMEPTTTSSTSSSTTHQPQF